MQLLALDAEFQPVAYLPYLNLQWQREYYSPGKFSVQLAAENYDTRMAYLYTPDRPEMGIIQKPELSETVKGRFVQLSGFFLEHLLNDKLVYPTYYAAGAMDAAVLQMITAYKSDIPKLEILPLPAAVAEASTWQVTGEALGTAACAKLKTVQMALRCRYDYQQDKIRCEVWQGLDRTQSQTVNNWVVFSDGFRNLNQVVASTDASSLKNYAIVAGAGEGAEREVQVVDQTGGGYARQLWVDARDLRWDEKEQTLAEYQASLRQRGAEKLLEHQPIQNVEVDVTDGTFRYLRDFDLGDKVDVIVQDIGLAMEARVVSVREVFKANDHIITVTMGDKKLTQLQKARMIY
ncbi:siphovirus ReqiPepy6 Gp37-like family protein [Allofournierella sp.]|uniref:siphovirus ReqiPepy6 Gp37-like family protein n=1 Tax=Allofournierella sp. TaxID=1940256 RepID=UPI003AEF4C2E